MAWFRRAKGPGGDEDEGPAGDRAADGGAGREPSTDTVGNPIVERRRGRHVLEPEHAAPSRAEHRMLQMIAEERVARTATGGANASFWRVDGAFATGPKAMMLDWLVEQDYVGLGPRARVVQPAVLTDRGRAVLDHPF